MLAPGNNAVEPARMASRSFARSDLSTLEAWVERAAVASCEREIFGDD
jgi:hypothetical protein